MKLLQEPTYIVRSCIALHHKCEIGDTSMLQFNNSQVAAQLIARKTLDSSFAYIVCFVYITLIIWSIVSMSTNHSHMQIELPTFEKINNKKKDIIANVCEINDTNNTIIVNASEINDIIVNAHEIDNIIVHAREIDHIIENSLGIDNIIANAREIKDKTKDIIANARKVKDKTNNIIANARKVKDIIANARKINDIIGIIQNIVYTKDIIANAKEKTFDALSAENKYDPKKFYAKAYFYNDKTRIFINKYSIPTKNIVIIKKSTLLDNMYRNTSLIGCWLCILLSDHYSVTYAIELLPPQLPSAQILCSIYKYRFPISYLWRKTITTTVIAYFLYRAVWRKVMLLTIPTLLGLTDEEDDSGYKLIGVSEKWKANNKRAEAWMEKMFEAILGLTMISLVRCILSRWAWHINFSAITDYNFVATLVTIPFVVDFPLYVVIFITGTTTCGLADAQWKLIQEQAKNAKNTTNVEANDATNTSNVEANTTTTEASDAINVDEKMKTLEKKRIAACKEVDEYYKQLEKTQNKDILTLLTFNEQKELNKWKKHKDKLRNLAKLDHKWTDNYLKLNGPMRSMLWLHGLLQCPRQIFINGEAYSIAEDNNDAYIYMYFCTPLYYTLLFVLFVGQLLSILIHQPVTCVRDLWKLIRQKFRDTSMLRSTIQHDNAHSAA